MVRWLHAALTLGLLLSGVQPTLAAAAVRSQEKAGIAWETGDRMADNERDEVRVEFTRRSVGALSTEDLAAWNVGEATPAMGANEHDAPGADPNPPFEIPVPPDDPPLPSMAMLSLEAVAPETVGAGEEVRVKVTAINVGAEKVSGAVVRLDEEKGRGFADDKSYPLPDLDVDERMAIEVTLRGAGEPGERLEGWLVVQGGNLIEPVRARVRTTVRQDAPETWQPQMGADTWRTRYGHLEIALPADRDEAIAVMTHRGLYGADEGSEDLLYRFELNAWDAQGRPVKRFNTPVTLRWHYVESGLVDSIAPETLSFVWQNPETGQWERMPTAHYLNAGYIEAQTSHFSTLGVASINDYVTGPEDPFTGLEADLFTGAAQYRYEIPLIPRPGGFAPGLALSYSSRRRDGKQAWGSADSYLGWGWRLDGLPVIRQPQSGVYKLSLGGGTYTLHDFAGDGKWKAAEAPWKFAIAHDVNSARSGMTDIKRWDVRTPDGTHYILEPVTDFWHCWDYDGNFVLKHEGIWWMTTEIIAGPDDGPVGGSNPYGGLNRKYKVTIDYDTATRTIDIPYSCGGQQDKPHYYDAWPVKMTYTGIGAGHSAEVEFRYASRNDYPPGCPDSATCEPYQNNNASGVYFHTKRLTDIIIKVDGVVQKRVHLESKIENPSASVGERRLFLKGVYVYGKGTTTGTLPSPLPDTPYRVTFEYSHNTNDPPDENWQASWNGRLKTIQNRQGGEATLAYTREMSATLDSIYYLSQLTLDDGVGSSQQTTIYEPDTWDEDAGGYDTMQVRTANYGGTGVQGKRTRHFFYHEGAGDDKRKNGLKKKLVRQVNANGQWEEVISYDYALPPGVSSSEADEARFLLSDEQRGRYFNGANFKWFNRSVYEYQTGSQGNEQYGNLTHRYDYLHANGSWQAQRLRWLSYYPCDYRYDSSTCNSVFVANRIAREKLWDLRSGWQCEADSLYYYDGNGSWTNKPKRGLVTKIRAATARDASNASKCTNWQTVATHGYDQWHNRTQTSDGLEHTTSFGYDANFHAFRTSVTNAKGHQTTYDYDYVLGVVTTVTDVDNGATTVIQYDDYGRAERMDRPLGAGLDAQGRAQDEIVIYGDYGSASSPSYVHLKRCETVSNNNCTGYLESATFYDGRGRVIQEQAEAEEAGQIILVNYAYDERGNLEKKSVPYQVIGSIGTYVSPDWNQPYTAYTYDGLDRPLSTTHPDGTVAETAYRYLETAVVDANDHQQVSEVDGFGRMIVSKQYLGAFSNGANFDANVYYQAQYEYDVADRLTQVKAGLTAPYEVTTITYDRLGRKTKMDDPDMGAWAYRYDATGNLIKQRDARHRAICFYYDALNRLVGKTYHANVSDLDNLTCSGSYAVSYSYDSTANGNKGVGRRTGMNDGSGSTSWVYDARGRVIKESKNINGASGSFKTEWEYDAMDRVKRMRYPDGPGGQGGEWVAHFYNAQGLLKELDGDQDYANDMTYTALGQLSSLRYEPWTNSVLTTLTYDYYDDPGEAKSFRLQRISSSDGKFDRAYVYDNVGNVTQINDYKFVNVDAGQAWSTTTKTYTFGYDALDRLTNGVTSNPSDHGYDYSYAYAPNGNFTKYRGNTNLDFGAPDSGFCSDHATAPLHALTHYNNEKYCYDENGNQLKRELKKEQGTGTDAWEFTYDAENRLTVVKKNDVVVAQFWYDGDGNRVKGVVVKDVDGTPTSTTTYYVGKHYEYSTGSACSGSSCNTKYYFANGGLVSFRRTGYTTNNGLRFVIRDHLNSTSLVMNGGGTTLWVDYFTPYGDLQHTWKKSTLVPLQTTYRYTGQRHEPDIKLYDYGARWYDNRRGRFTQPDTIVPNPGDPQSLNRYAYVRNNPVRYTDPSGHAICVTDDCVVRVHPVSEKPIGMRQKWGIIMRGKWEKDKAWMVYEGLRTISERVGKHLRQRNISLSGDEWIRKNIGGTTFERWPNSKPFVYDDEVNYIEFPVHPAITLFNLVYQGKFTGPTGFSAPQLGNLFPSTEIHFFDAMDESTPVHEIGHIVDYRNIFASQKMAQQVVLSKSPTSYGRENSLEDFAESWRYWVYNFPGLTVDRQQFIESLVVQASR